MCKAINDLIEEGRSKGFQDGFQNGERLAAKVIHMSIHGENESTISKLCEIPIEKVREILQFFQ